MGFRCMPPQESVSASPFEPEVRKRQAGGGMSAANVNHRTPVHTRIPSSPRPGRTREAIANAVHPLCPSRALLAPFQGASQNRGWSRHMVRWFSLAKPRFTIGCFPANLRLDCCIRHQDRAPNPPGSVSRHAKRTGFLKDGPWMTASGSQDFTRELCLDNQTAPIGRLLHGQKLTVSGMCSRSARDWHQ
jgi:hypothetical protein